jgi:hypothetical protein
MKKILAGFALLFSFVVNAAPFTVNHLIDTVPNPSINYQSSATGSVARSYQSKLGDTINVLDFGADPTGVADSSSNVQAAVNYACSLSKGAAIIIPQGSFKLSGITATCQGLFIKGAGVNATTILGSSLTGNTFTFSAPGHQGISDMTISINGAPTAGAAVAVNGVLNYTMDKVKIINPFQGININGGVIQYYSDIEIRNIQPSSGVGIYISGFGNDQFLKNIVMDNTSTAQPLACIRINNTNAVWIDSVDAIHCGTGLLVDPQAATDYISWLFVSNSAFDTSSGSGITLAPANASAVIKGVNFIGSWTSTNTTLGVNIAGVGIVDGVRFVGHRAYNNGQSGYFISSSNAANIKNVSFNNSDASGNSQNSLGTFSGFDVGADVSGFSITNSRSGQEAGFSNTQNRGILINPGAGNNYMVTGNDLRGNTVGLYDGGTGANKIINSNLGSTVGWVTEPGAVVGAKSAAANTTVGNGTLTAAKMLTGNILRSGSTAPYTDTTDTATNIVASIPNAVAGVGYELTITNTVAFTETIAAGAGVTLSGTTAISASSSRKYVVTITNVSTPAVTITGVSSGGL